MGFIMYICIIIIINLKFINMEVHVPETRGKKPKYDFNLGIGDMRSYEDVSLMVLLNCAKSYCKQRSLDWRFRCYTMDGMSHIIRVK